jgi:hypothetical protein
VANAQPNRFIDPLAEWLAEYYSRAGSAVAYAKRHCLDMDDVLAHAGTIATARCWFDGKGYFSFDDDGEPAIVIEAYDVDDETTIDLLAWPMDRPETFATALGAATVLGIANVFNPASWAISGLLRIHRTPLSWLKAGCCGCVILDHRFAPYLLGQAFGPMLAENEGHARTLKAMLCQPPVDPTSIFYSIAESAAA